jgi:TonB family protein
MRSFLIVLVFCALTAVGQTPGPKVISGGVLNGKAVSLIKPAFPAAARVVGACGAVNIQITIAEDGTVISAAAVSGHPLLRAAATDAARASKFSPTLLSGQPVKVTGIIVYNFLCPMSLMQIGYDISQVERGETWFQANNIASNLPEEWTSEKTQAGEIGRILDLKARPEISADKTVSTDSVNETSSSKAGGNAPIATTVATAGGGKFSKTLDDDQVTVKARNLIESINARLSNEPSKLWLFELGVVAGRLAPDSADDQRFRESVEALAMLLDRAPTGTSASLLEKANELLNVCRNPGQSEKIAEAAKALRAVKVN